MTARFSNVSHTATRARYQSRYDISRKLWFCWRTHRMLARSGYYIGFDLMTRFEGEL